MGTNVENKLNEQDVKGSNVNEYITKVLQLIEKEKVSEEEANWIQKETVDGFREHVNPGFLAYRKTVTKDGQFAAVEWSDEGSCFMDINGKNILTV